MDSEQAGRKGIEPSRRGPEQMTKTRCSGHARFEPPKRSLKMAGTGVVSICSGTCSKTMSRVGAFLPPRRSEQNILFYRVVPVFRWSFADLIQQGNKSETST